MALPTPQEKELLKDAPRGTWALMLIIGAFLMAGWLILYFGRFLANGVVR